MQSDSTLNRLNREAAQRELRGRREKKVKELLRFSALDPQQPFVVFVLGSGAEPLRSFSSFEEAFRFLFCLVKETAERANDLGRFPIYGIQHTVHGIPCGLGVELASQLARDFGFLTKAGKLSRSEVPPWQVDISFLATALGAEEGEGGASTFLTEGGFGLKSDWAEAIERRLAALEK